MKLFQRMEWWETSIIFFKNTNLEHQEANVNSSQIIYFSFSFVKSRVKNFHYLWNQLCQHEINGKTLKKKNFINWSFVHVNDFCAHPWIHLLFQKQGSTQIDFRFTIKFCSHKKWNEDFLQNEFIQYFQGRLFSWAFLWNNSWVYLETKKNEANFTTVWNT